MRKFSVVILLVFTALGSVKAQGITVNEEPLIAQMMASYTGVNKATAATQMIDGFRIQLAATTDRRKVDQMLATFSGK